MCASYISFLSSLVCSQQWVYPVENYPLLWDPRPWKAGQGDRTGCWETRTQFNSSKYIQHARHMTLGGPPLLFTKSTRKVVPHHSQWCNGWSLFLQEFLLSKCFPSFLSPPLLEKKVSCSCGWSYISDPSDSTSQTVGITGMCQLSLLQVIPVSFTNCEAFS